MAKRTPPRDHAPDELFEFSGDITDYWSYSQIRDYVLLMSGLSHTALRLYLILRSMIKETSSRRRDTDGRGGLRRMTIDQLCWLCPGPNDKPLSISAMYELLKVLEKVDLVVPKDTREVEGASALKGKQKAARGIARGFTVKDLPPLSYTGWRNAWDKLDAYTPDWRENPPQPPTHSTELSHDDGRITAHVRLTGPGGQPFQKTGTPQVKGDSAPSFQKSGTSSQDSGTPSRDSGTDLPLTSENDHPQRSSLEEASSSSAGAAPSQPAVPAEAETGGEKKTASPQKGTAPSTAAEEPDTHDDVRVAEAWITSREAHGHGVPPLARTRVIKEAAELLAAGHDPEYLVAAAADMGRKEKWFILRRHLEWYVQPNTSLPGPRPALPQWCGTCNDGIEPQQPGHRMREVDGRLVRCECHPSHGKTPTLV